MEQKGRLLKDGSLKMLNTPWRKMEWHNSKDVCPSLQWQPETGMTRYEWARRHTPEHQRPFWEGLREAYQQRPPRVVPEELMQRAQERAKATCADGMPGLPNDLVDEFLQYRIYERVPSLEWSVSITRENGRFGELQDHLCIACLDYRTMPDWELMVRLRSWVLPDDREAFMWLPPQPPHLIHLYENARPNNLQWISPLARPWIEEAVVPYRQESE